MDFMEAIALVLELAEQNALTEREVGGDRDLAYERERQLTAIEVVHRVAKIVNLRGEG